MYAQTSELFNDSEEIGRLLNAYSTGIERIDNSFALYIILYSSLKDKTIITS
jgi:hypothetical protein